MSALYGSLSGDNKKELTTRGLGYITAHVRGWEVGARVNLRYDKTSGAVSVKVYKTSGSNGSFSDVLVASFDDVAVVPGDKIPLKHGDIITVSGRRWFDKINGNTYHSVSVWVNAEFVGHVPFAYGYDSAYIQTARDLLEQKYIIPAVAAGFWGLSILRDAGIKIIDIVSDVATKKML